MPHFSDQSFDPSIPYLDEFKDAVGPEAAENLRGLRRVSMDSIRGGYAKDAVGMYDPMQHEVAFREGAISRELVGHELAHALQRGNGNDGAGAWAKLSSAANQHSAQEDEADRVGMAFAASRGTTRISLPQLGLSRSNTYAKRFVHEVQKELHVYKDDKVTFVPLGMELKFSVWTGNSW